MMSPDTHYIAASSELKSQVKAAALKLPSEWHLNHDWTQFEYPVQNESTLAQLDLLCATHADVFIFLDSHYISRGAMMEYGARLAIGGGVIHIGCQDSQYLFFKHQNVSHYVSIEAFLEDL